MQDVDNYSDTYKAEIIRQAVIILDGQLREKGATLSDPTASRRFLRLQLSELEHEVFSVLFLDTRHRLIEYVELFRGTINGSSVHPREVVKEALKRNAAAVIFAHNHPSGVAEPSHADKQITDRLRDALAMVEVKTLDHIIVGDGEEVAFAERGWL